MKTRAEKSAATTAPPAATLAARPFFARPGSGSFFEPQAVVVQRKGRNVLLPISALQAPPGWFGARPTILPTGIGSGPWLGGGEVVTNSQKAAVEPTEASQESGPLVPRQPETEKAPPTAGAAPVAAKPKAPAAAPVSAAPGKASEPAAEAAPEAVATPTAPKSAREDPEFGKVIAQTRQVRRGQRMHKEPKTKNDAVVASAHLPEAEQQAYNDRTHHLEVISQAADSTKNAGQKFTAAQFKEVLKTQLGALETKLPHSEDETKRFKREKPLESIKNDVKQQVEDENAKVAQPIATETRTAEAPPSHIEPKKPELLVEEKPGIKPPAISPVAAAPKPKADREISMEKDSRSLDELMAKNHNTEDQFAESNEPKFQQALKTKQDAQAKAAEVPQVYRAKEQGIIAGAQQHASREAATGFGAMHGLRGAAFGGVFAQQTQQDKGDKDEQKRIKHELDLIYEGTKKEVDDIFTALSKYVEDTFETESGAAKTAFEERVESQLDDIHGWGVHDFFFGEDTAAIEDVFAVEKQKFLDAMDRTLGTIAQRIADDLNRAVVSIQQGKARAETFYKNLSTEQQKLAADAMETYRVQFANLESGVDEKQKELASSLAASYQQQVGALRQTFDKLNEEARKTWIERAADFIRDVALTIYRLGELLVTVLVRIAHVIGEILAHPIRFLENLAAGIKQGFATFIGNFDTYLIEGFFNWLKGKVGGAGIKIPAKLDTAGLFSITLQVIGLTYDNFREIARAKLGDPVVEAIEKGVEGAQEVYKLIQLARTDMGAFWTHIKEVLANAVDEIFDKIKQTVLYETIKRVLAYIVTLFNPAGAFIKAAQAIYAGIRFLMDNMERIIALVNAFLDGVEMAVAGNVSGIASRVVAGLQNAIVAGIDFLAKLLGLGDLADKVRSIIRQLKAPVDRALGFVVDKVLKPVVALVQKGINAVKAKAGAIKARVLEWWKARTRFEGEDGESHELYFNGEAANADLVVASKPRTVKAFLADVDGEIAEMPSGERKTKAKGTLKTAGDLNIEVLDLKDQLAKTKADSEDVQANQKLFGTLQGKLAALAKQLASLMGLTGHEGNPPPPMLPPFADSVRARSQEAQYLSADNNVPAGEASTDHAGNLGGWQELVDEGTRARDNYVRMHLLHHKMGGRATDSNLTPAKSVINSDYYNSLERPALEDSGLLTGRKSTKKNPNKVIWFSVKVDYHSGDAWAKNFISSIAAKYGYHDPDDNWKKGPAVGSWGATPGVPDHETKKFVLNEDGRTALGKMKYPQRSFSADLVDLVVTERNESLKTGGKRLYASPDDVYNRLVKRIQENRLSSSLTDEADRLSNALDATNSTIVLNGTDS